MDQMGAGIPGTGKKPLPIDQLKRWRHGALGGCVAGRLNGDNQENR